jgi:nucleoid-associated protein YgaU
MTRRAVGALVGALGMALTAGCGKPVLRIADPSLGDYYSEREFRGLRKEQRDEYCAELAEQDSSYRAAMADLRNALAEIEARRAAATAGADSLTRLADSLEVRVGEARRAAGTPAGGTGRPVRAASSEGRHVVVPGESLWRIAADPAAYGDGRKWRRIYEANRDAIRDPNFIHPGQELRIPQ